MFCERCGTRQPSPPPEPNTPGVLARKLLDATGFTTAERERRPTDEYLRLCLGCREYSCPTCWNDEVGVCQTCAPLPEPVVVWVAPERQPEPVVVLAEPVVVAEPEPEPVLAVIAEPEPEPVPAIAAEPEPVLAVVAAPELEPIAAEPADESEPEPIAAEPEPEPEPTRPAQPRMPILPLPRPRRPESELPLPPIFDYPVAPQIHFERMNAAHIAQPEFPAYASLPVPAQVAAASPSVRPSHNCQLSVSAKARFCRRCGSAQVA